MYRAKNDVPANNTEPHNDTANWELWDLSAYLPLAGGTMTGAIFAGNAPRALVGGNNSNDTSKDLSLHATWYGNKGATLNLCGKDYSGNPGRFILGAADGTNTPKLVGFPDGRMIWDNNDLAGSAIVAKSLTNENSWYYKLASGLIVQGGLTSTPSFTNTTGGSYMDFNLPISFSSFYNVVAIPQIATPYIVNCVTYNISMSKMRISMNKDNTANFTMKYVAVGY
jgi:hypothetical protein